MDAKLEPLFTPWKIRNLEIKNRIVMTSMGGTSIFGWMENNHFDEEASKFLLSVAKNNVGLVLPGIQPIYNPMYGQWLYENKKMYKKLASFMDEIHKTGAKMFVQLTAGFGRSFTITKTMEKLYTNKFLRALSRPIMDLDKITASASPLPNRWSDKVPSREMTKDEIHEFIAAFANVSYMLKEAGVDGVEIHAVHEGYLLDQFALKYTNHRKDEYGGSLENRYRFAAEIVKAIKDNCGNDFPVSLRFSAVSKTKDFRKGAVPGEDYVEVGRDIDEAIIASKYLTQAGYDMLNCDNGTYDAWYYSHPPIYMDENCNVKEVEIIKKNVTVPVVCAGRMDPYFGATEVKEGRLDAIGFARPFLADQEWVTKLIYDQKEDIRPCICCHNGCFNMAHYKGVPNDQDLKDALHMARCALNAETMQSDVHHLDKVTDYKKRKTVAIIGGGIAGMEVARDLKLRGHNPVIYEKTDRLGGIFNAVSSASFKGKLRELLEWYKTQMKKMNIEVHLNTEVNYFTDIKSDAYVICTGSKAITPKIPGYERGIDALDFLNGKEVGRDVCVIGGGLTGSEIAYELSLMGKHPFIVEMKQDLICQKGVCLANSSFLRDYFEYKKIPVYLNSTVTKIGEDYVTIMNVKDNKEKKYKKGVIYNNIAPLNIRCDSVIFAIGYKPNPMKTKNKKVYYVGDCNKVGNLRTVIWNAYEVAMKI